MKIISKYKDYYDYLQGIYGVDEKLVLDRRESDHPMYYQNGRHVFVIGDLMVDVLHIDGKFYCGESDMIKLGGTKIENKSQPNIINYRVEYLEQSSYFLKKEISTIRVTAHRKNRVDDNFNQYAIYKPESLNTCIPYPRLEQYGIQKVLKPHDIWVELSNWLGKQLTKNEPTVPIGDDKIRIISAGFDLKTSFRNVK